MELLKFNHLLADGGGEKTAIILCTQDKILKVATYKDVHYYAEQVEQFMLNNVGAHNICIGLFMEKNILLPSIILSFQELQYSFVFLTSQTLTKTVQNLNIEWVLTYGDSSLPDSFISKNVLQFSTNEQVRLWKNHFYLENIEHLSFENIFCVVHTSGTTGENKIIRVPHFCIEKNVLALRKHFELIRTDIIYWGTPLTFDPTLVEFLLGIFCQAALLIVPKLISLNPQFLYDALFKICKITFLQMVPSVFLRWNNEQIRKILQTSCLRTLAFGGETFPRFILDYEMHDGLSIYNLYGVTELSCWATISKICSLASGNTVQLGMPLDETFIELHNDDGKTISNGVGEIHIGSNSRFCLINVTNGQVKFPYVVKTGDLGLLNSQGLFYMGRKTRTVKRFGHKINLHNLEEIILKETNLSSRLVYSFKHNKLLAFILIDEHFNESTKIRLFDKLRVKLLKIIPETEFPDFIDVLLQFPLNEHGKICDKKLEQYYENHLSNRPEICNPKQLLIDILGNYLRTEFRNNVEVLGKYNFFELGGTSILAMQMLSEFEECIGGEASGELVTLLLNENIHSCLNYVQNNVSLKRKTQEDVKKNIVPEKLKKYSESLDRVVWTYDFKGCVDSSPLVFENSKQIYIAAGSFANIFAILSEDGDQYLKVILPQHIEAKPSVSKCGNFIFTGCSDGSIYCVDFSLKTVIWQYKTEQKIACTACLCRNREYLAFGSYDNFVYCLNAKDGALLWKTKVLGSVRADPLYCESLKIIYVGTTKGMCYAINECNGSVIWSRQLDGPIFSAPCIVNKCIIWPLVTGDLCCLSSAGEMVWTQKVKGHIFSSLTAFENKIYFGCHDSRLYELTVIDDTTTINYFQLESEISSTPYVFNSVEETFVVCVCNIGILYVISLSSKEIVFRFELPAQSFSAPCVFKNKVYVGCRDNNLYCIDIEEFLIK